MGFILVLSVLGIISYITEVRLAPEPEAANWKKVIIFAAMILVSSSLLLFVSQSVLTRESIPVNKHKILEDGSSTRSRGAFVRYSTPLEMPGFCFMGTNVVSGRNDGGNGSHRVTDFLRFVSKAGGRRAVTGFDLGVNEVTFFLIKVTLIAR